MIRVGLIGLDMSHAVAFTEMLNAPTPAVPGGRVTVAWAGDSPDFDLSWSRVGAYTHQVRDVWNVPIVASPRDVAAACDLVLITAADGRVHRALFEQVAPYAKPTFVGKPVALNLVDTQAVFDLAARHGTPLMSSSALRYSEPVTAARADPRPVLGCDVFGPGPLEPTQPGFFWYGIHCVEMVVATLGVGCTGVSVGGGTTDVVITLHWPDGRVATVRQIRNGASTFGMTVHRVAGPTYADTDLSKTPTALPLLRTLVGELATGVSPVPPTETLEVVRIVEAANHSFATGRPVELHPRSGR